MWRAIYANFLTMIFEAKCNMNPPTNFIIRRAEPADIQEITKLCAEHAEYEMASYSPEGKAEKLSAFLFAAPHPRLFCLIAETPHGIIGYATYMQEFSTWDAGLFIHLDCLFVRPEARSAGLGEKLIRAVVEHARELGCEQIQWQTPEWNERAINFYHRIGATSKPKLRMYLDTTTFQ